MDHYALVALTNKSLADLTVKLKELFLKLRPYNYYTTHIAGAGNIVSDALSRAVRWSKKPDVEKEEEAFKEGVERVFARKVTAQENSQAFLWRDPLMQDIMQEAGMDNDYKQVAELIKERRDRNYIKSKLSSEHPARSFLPVRHER